MKQFAKVAVRKGRSANWFRLDSQVAAGPPRRLSFAPQVRTPRVSGRGIFLGSSQFARVDHSGKSTF